MPPIYEEIAYDVRDGIATVTLDRPQSLNAFTHTMYTELVDVFDQIDQDDSVRAVVLTGRGRAFCAGADLSEPSAAFAVTGAAEDHRDIGGILNLRIVRALKPVIAAVNGPAVGIGASMTLVADVRFAADTAKIGFPFTRRGIVADGCSSFFLPRVVGISRAQEWLLTGRVFPASEALAAGLVRSVHPAEELLPAAYALAREIADHAAPVSVAYTRQMLWRMLEAGHPEEAHRLESQLLFERGRSGDVREGVAAFLEKRAASFPDAVSGNIDVLRRCLPGN